MKIKIVSIKFIIYFLALAAILPSIRPLLRSDFFQMHDYTHVARLYEMDKALKDGQLPVRWAKDLGWGYGMPLFNFYAPLPYYFAELFHLLGFSFINSIKICFGATFFIAFLGMCLLASKFWGRYGGILSAVAFVYSPYRSVDFYVRGALGELFAISLIPLSIWAIFEVIEKRKIKKIIFASLMISSLFLSHTILTFIAAPLLFIIGTFYSFINKNKVKSFMFFLFSFLLTLGISSFFLIPAFFEKQYTRVDDLIQGFSYYGHHFLYWRQFLYGNWGYGGSVDGINDGMSFHLGKIHLFLVLITLIITVFITVYRRRITQKSTLILFFSLLAIFLGFLSTYHAKPIWDFIPLMAYIQFPWRLNSFNIVFVAFLSGGILYYLKSVDKKIFLFLFIGILLLIIKVNLRYFKPEKYINTEILYYTDENLIKQNISGVIPDYLPKSVEDIPGVSDKDFSLINSSANINITSSKTQELDLTIESDEKTILQLNRFYFPGWQLKVDYKQKPINYDRTGIIKLEVDSGLHEIQLKFEDTPVRRISNLLSFASLLFIFFIIVISKKNFSKKS